MKKASKPPRKPGRPRLGSRPKIRINICLDPAIAEHLRALGGGNLSLGIERAAKENRARE